MSMLAMVAYGIDPGFLRACDQTLQVVLTACRFITPSLMGIALLYTIGRGFISGSGLAMDWGPIIKATWIFFLLFFYQTLMDTLGTGLAAFTALFATDKSAAEAIRDLTTPASVAAAARNDSMGIGDIVAGASSLMTSISQTLSSFTLLGYSDPAVYGHGGAYHPPHYAVYPAVHSGLSVRVRADCHDALGYSGLWAAGHEVAAEFSGRADVGADVRAA